MSKWHFFEVTNFLKGRFQSDTFSKLSILEVFVIFRWSDRSKKTASVTVLKNSNEKSYYFAKPFRSLMRAFCFSKNQNIIQRWIKYCGNLRFIDDIFSINIVFRHTKVQKKTEDYKYDGDQEKHKGRIQGAAKPS